MSLVRGDSCDRAKCTYLYRSTSGRTRLIVVLNLFQSAILGLRITQCTGWGKLVYTKTTNTQTICPGPLQETKRRLGFSCPFRTGTRQVHSIVFVRQG